MRGVSRSADGAVLTIADPVSGRTLHITRLYAPDGTPVGRALIEIKGPRKTRLMAMQAEPEDATDWAIALVSMFRPGARFGDPDHTPARGGRE